MHPLRKTQLDYAQMDCVYLVQIYHQLRELDTKIKKNQEIRNLEALSRRYKLKYNSYY
ncbi:hypothetical protein [Geminocystis sp. NIES-3708]|uniref:hypothetical protein n=1 Tax=Geminocystis sp. NIES-3708 TaxID=1615909 RepID=UPI0011877412